jgi:phospholipid transport system substrate-binding protein
MREYSVGRTFFAAIRPLRLLFVVLVLAAGLTGVSAPAIAASPSEQFIADNVQRGLTILNNKSLSKEQRRSQFQEFLIGLTDIKAISEYTLGQYRRAATPPQLAAFDDAFKDYALAVYQVYFNKFSGQTLQVSGSYPLAPGETVVKTIMVDPNKPNNPKPLNVDFRVASEGARLAVIDFSVEGVWLRETERSDFTSVLGQNSGDIGALTAILKTKSQQQSTK